MAKGLCCAAQQHGDLGRPLLILVHHKDGTTSQRCGTCEVVPSCRDPNKRVFRFKFISSLDCNIPGKAKCVPTAAGIVEYQANIPFAARGAEPFFYTPNGFAPTRITTPRPYTLPLP